MTPGRRYLREGWQFCATSPGACAVPADLAQATPAWRATTVPSTAASALLHAGEWSLDGPERRFDAEDWWYRLEFDFPELKETASPIFGFDGLATLCDAWLNDEPILRSDNMYVSHNIETPPLRTGRNTLHFVFRSLDHALKQKRPRPRWRAPMIEHQQLRWHRTTLLGRTPGWSPPAATVGPWRPVWVQSGRTGIECLQLRALLDGAVGRLQFEARSWDAQPLELPELQLRLDGAIVASCSVQQSGTTLTAQLAIADAQPWWPHTHGTPTLYEAVLHWQAGTLRQEQSVGHVGFRRVEVDHTDGDFRLSINGAPVFCRGACWTPLDIVSLRSDHDACRAALLQAADAGFNMLRISGTLVYEESQFFELCDQLGILVWQEFMLANMDYPAADAAFLASLHREATQQLSLWARHPCVVVICGNSEVSQQAAMWGAPRELWSPSLFDDVLATLANQLCLDTAYWPSSATGGDFPHQVRAGTCSYYGFGAYLRPQDDLRRAGLRFATECLAFANVPEAGAMEDMPGGSALRVHHPTWKRRTPRDLGAGWDFEDVRDHYVKQLFDVDPAALRYSDHARYIEIARRAPAEAMSMAFTEWRRRDSGCRGALVWFLRDLWAGAGWGIIDAGGQPKAPWYALRRTLQPLWIGLTDEGLNGISMHACNERAQAFDGEIELLLYRQGRHLITRAVRKFHLAARSACEITTASMLDEFHDLTHAYRFGPLACDLVVAMLRDGSGQILHRAFHLPLPHLHTTPDPACILDARAESTGPGEYLLHVHSVAYARSVHIEAPGFCCDDQYFDMAPNSNVTVALRAVTTGATLAGQVNALNGAAPARIVRQ
jgi:beta-mannosidase